MDKAEMVAEEISTRWPQVSKHGIAFLLRREYGDVRREALEEAARIAEDFVCDVRPDAPSFVGAAIRAAKEET